MLKSGQTKRIGDSMASSIGLSTLKNCIASGLINEEYSDNLAWVHEQIFQCPTMLFQTGFYLERAHQIHAKHHYNVHLSKWKDLYSLAGSVVRGEQIFKKSVLEASSLEGFKKFMPIFTEFTEAYYQFLKKNIPYSPLFFIQKYPLTVDWFINAIKEIANENEKHIKSPIYIFRMAILKAIQLPESDAMPEFFKGREDFRILAQEHSSLSAREQLRLRRVLMGFETSNKKNAEHRLFLKINELHDKLEKSDKEMCSGAVKAALCQFGVILDYPGMPLPEYKDDPVSLVVVDPPPKKIDPPPQPKSAWDSLFSRFSSQPKRDENSTEMVPLTP